MYDFYIKRLLHLKLKLLNTIILH